MKEKILKTIRKYKMIEKGDNVLVGVSGGPDSMALLHILYEMKGVFGIRLCVAHLNHNLRGKASEADKQFVKADAQKLNLPFYSKKLAKAALKAKGSKEELMRNKRYKFFLQAAKKFKADKIALAHTSDDQAETVLMRLIKGSGLRGISGIPPKRALGKYALIRPFIETSKKEILDFLKKRNLNYRKDASNFDEAYLRNSIRHKLIPFIRENYNPCIKDALCELSDIAREDDMYIEEAAAKIANSKFQFPISKLQNLPLALRRRVLRIAIEQIKGDLRHLEFRHLDAVEELIRTKVGKLNLPCGIAAVVKNGSLIISKGSRVRAVHSGAIYTIKSEVFNNGWAKNNFARIIRNKNKLVEYFDYDRLRVPVKTRFRKSGDMIRPFGMEGRKPLKELFIDNKVEQGLRGKLPVAVSGNNILWIAGVRRSSLAPVSGETKKILKLSLVRGFTLLEVLIAMTIIVTLVIGTMGAFVAAKKAIFHSRNRVAALHFAKETAERLKDYVTYDTAKPEYKDRNGKYALEKGIHQDDPLNVSYWEDLQKFSPSREYEVADVDSNGDGVPDYKKVTITVTWDEPRI